MAANFQVIYDQTFQVLKKGINPRLLYQPGQHTVISPFAMTAFNLLSREPIEDNFSNKIRVTLAKELKQIGKRWQKSCSSDNIQFVIFDHVQRATGHGGFIDLMGSGIFLDSSVVPKMGGNDSEGQKKIRRALTEEIIHINDIRTHFSDRADIKARLEGFASSYTPFHSGSQPDYQNFFNFLRATGLIPSNSNETYVYCQRPKELLACAVLAKEYIEADIIQKQVHERGGLRRLTTRALTAKELEDATNNRLSKIIGNDMIGLIREFERVVDERATGIASIERIGISDR